MAARRRILTGIRCHGVDFLFHFAKPDGQIGPFGNGWAGETAYSIETLARHCLLTGDADCWRCHREAAFRGFGWIEAKRRETAAGGDGLVAATTASRRSATIRRASATSGSGRTASS